MAIDFQINGTADPAGRYVSWAPSPCSLELTTADDLTSPLSVTLRNKPSTSGGAVVFYSDANAKASNTLSVTLNTGTPVRFLVGGKFGKPSAADGDVTIQVMSGTKVLSETPLMVRIRKNANTLSTGERDRFIAALAQLNNRGAGRYADFRNIHNQAGSPQAHGSAGFLPWHRAFLLDLERQLQGFDPSVTLPYWRFDQKAPAIFTRDFMGASDSLGRVVFGTTNPLQFWVTDGVPGIKRRPLFNVATQAARNVLTEAQTLALGNDYADFRNLEDNPHGYAHTSFGGSISSIPTAVKDPIFFMLHCNVDRLWAKWQQKLNRYDPGQAASFDSTTPPGGNPVGHNLADTMWPWNGMTGGNRPPTAPGGPMPDSVCVSAPGPQPHVADMLDYRGVAVASSRQGFDYDDVPA
jgi:tyrosinase